MYDDDVIFRDSGVVCPASYLYLCISVLVEFMLYLPVVENPAATRVRVS